MPFDIIFGFIPEPIRTLFLGLITVVIILAVFNFIKL